MLPTRCRWFFEALATLALLAGCVVVAAWTGCSLAQPIQPNAAASNTASNTATASQAVTIPPVVMPAATVVVPPATRPSG